MSYNYYCTPDCSPGLPPDKLDGQSPQHFSFPCYDDLVYEDMWSINYPYQPNGDVNTAPAVHDYNQNFGSFRPGPVDDSGYVDMERELRELPYPPINDWGWPDSPGSSNAPCPPSPVMSMQQPRQQVANFIRSKLEGPGRDDTLVTWYDRDKGIFRVVNSRRLANLWGAQKNRPNMTFAKMARGIRERRKAGDFVQLTGEEARRLPRRLIFKFGKKILQ